MYEHPLAGLLWEGQFGKSSKTNGRKYQDGNAFFSGTAKKFCLCVFVDDKKRQERRKNQKTMWDKLRNNVDLEEPGRLLDQLNLGCAQRECKTDRRIVEEIGNNFKPSSQQAR